jgi:putative salt-induced outer membrane protein
MAGFSICSRMEVLMRISALTLAGFAGVVVFSGLAAAQQPPAAPPPPPPLWSGQLDASFLAATGNSDNKTFGSGLLGVWNPAPWRVEAKAGFASASNLGTTTARRFLSSLKAERELNNFFGVYGLFGYARDTFAGYTGLENIEGGAFYRAVTLPRHTLTFSVGAVQTFEQRILPDLNRNFLGGRIGLNYHWKITDNAEFVEDAGMHLNFEDSPDWRFINQAAVVSQITKTVGLKIANDLFYRHQPIAGKKGTDSVFRAGLVAKF